MAFHKPFLTVSSQLVTYTYLTRGALKYQEHFAQHHTMSWVPVTCSVALRSTASILVPRAVSTWWFEYSKKHQPKSLGVLSHERQPGLLNAGAHELVDVAFPCARISWQLLYTSIKQSSRGLALWRPKGRKAQSRWTRELRSAASLCNLTLTLTQGSTGTGGSSEAECRPHSTLLEESLTRPSAQPVNSAKPDLKDSL